MPPLLAQESPPSVPTVAPLEIPPATRVGAPVMFMPDVNRLTNYLKQPPERNCPIPNLSINRETYFKWLEFSGHLKYAREATTHGQYGPRHFMPVLAKYVESGDLAYGNACIQMLKTFDTWIRKDVAEKGWQSMFCEEFGYIGLYRHVLADRGLISPQKDLWLKELILFMARNIHAWNSTDTYWRGPMHRAQGEGALKGLAAIWHPDAPEAAEWKDYSDTVYQDWWKYRDLAPNDVNYLFVGLQSLFLRALFLHDREFFNDPQMKQVWERLIFEVSPDGSIPPYGAHIGWNASAGNRIAMLEILASQTGDGRYRFVAHRLMNYLLYQRGVYRSHHVLLGPETTEPLSLAYLFTDETILPVMPDAGSRILYRKETVRLASNADKKKATEMLGENARLDPRADRGLIDCAMLLTDTPKPSKLVLRSGWNPGDFFVLVDLFPRHDPLNPLGIVGMTRFGAALTSTIAAKGDSDENRVVIRPLDPTVIDAGPPAAPETIVEAFVESELVSYASIEVSNYDSAPVTCTRHFLFIKNDFLLVRDDVRLDRDLNVQISSVFNTQNVGPKISPHAAITHMSQPVAVGTGLLNPAVDLLVFFCPQPSCSMQVVDRTASDQRSTGIPTQLRWSWQGAGRKDQAIHFCMLLRPQPPDGDQNTVSMASVHAPASDQLHRLDTAAYEVLLNDSSASVLRLQSGPDRRQWVVINPTGKLIELPDIQTDAQAAYIVVQGKEEPICWAHNASRARVTGRVLKLPAAEPAAAPDSLPLETRRAS